MRCLGGVVVALAVSVALIACLVPLAYASASEVVIRDAASNVGILGWGANDQCQLGNGRRSRAESFGLARMMSTSTFFSPVGLTPPRDPSSLVFSDVACSVHHCIALSSDGDVFTWGGNYTSGRLTLRHVTKVAQHATAVSCNQVASYYIHTNGSLFTTSLTSPTGWEIALPGLEVILVRCGFTNLCLVQLADLSIKALGSLGAASLDKSPLSSRLSYVSLSRGTVVIQEQNNNTGYWWIGSNRATSLNIIEAGSTSPTASNVWRFVNFETEVASQMMVCGTNGFRLANGHVYALGSVAYDYGGTGIDWKDMTPASTGISDIIDLSCAGGIGMFRRSSEPNRVFILGGEHRFLIFTGPVLSHDNFTKIQEFGSVLRGWKVNKLMTPSSASPVVFLLLTRDSSSDGSTSKDSTYGRIFGLGSNSYGQLMNGRMSKSSYGSRGFFSPQPASQPLVQLLGGDKWSTTFQFTTSTVSKLTTLGQLPVGSVLNNIDSFSVHPQTFSLSYPAKRVDATSSQIWWHADVTGTMMCSMIMSGEMPFCFSTPNATLLSCSADHCITNNGSQTLVFKSNLEAVLEASVDLGSPLSKLSIGANFFVASMSNGVLRSFSWTGDTDGTGCTNTSCSWTEYASITALASGSYHTVFINSNLVYTFGSNGQGQLGRTDAYSVEPQVVVLPIVTDVACLKETTFALTGSGDLYAWGQLALLGLHQNIDTTYSNLPVFVTSNIEPGSLCKSCRSSFMLAITTPSFADPIAPTTTPLPARVTWGPNSRSQLGTGQAEEVTIPTAVSMVSALGKSAALPMTSTSLPFIGLGSQRSLYLSTQEDGSVMSVYGHNIDEVPNSFSSYDYYPPIQNTNFTEEGSYLWGAVKPSFKASVMNAKLKALASDSQNILALSHLGVKRETSGNWASLSTVDLSAYDFIVGSTSTSYAIYSRNGLRQVTSTGFNPNTLPTYILGFTFHSSTLQPDSIIYSNSSTATTALTFRYIGQNALMSLACGEEISAFASTNPLDSRFVIHNSDGVFTCGITNNYGELGYIGSPTDGWKQVMIGPVDQIASLPNTNFVLSSYPNPGSVYVWGLNGPESWFGFQTSPFVLYSPQPILIPWTSTIFNSPGAVFGFPSSAFVQSMTVTRSNGTAGYSSVQFYIEAAPILSCTGSAPGPTFVCIGSTWVSTSDVAVPVGSQIVIGGPTVINGDLQIESGGALVLEFGSNLDVNGCIISDGSTTIILTEQDLKDLESESGKSRTVTLVSARCSSGNGLSNVEISAPSRGCKKLVVNRQDDDPSSDQRTYTAVFKVDTSRCNHWWIILVSVLGGVILLVLIFALLATFTPLKSVIHPFSKRAKKNAQEDMS